MSDIDAKRTAGAWTVEATKAGDSVDVRILLDGVNRLGFTFGWHEIDQLETALLHCREQFISDLAREKRGIQ